MLSGVSHLLHSTLAHDRKGGCILYGYRYLSGCTGACPVCLLSSGWCQEGEAEECCLVKPLYS